MMNRILSSVFLFVFGSFGLQAVPAVLNYAGQVAVNGQPFDGQGLFKFALVNADGNASYWSNDGTSANGSEPAAHVSIPVNGGLYSLLLGNTAMAGMGAIDPQVFTQHGDAKLRVWFSDGVNGFQQLSPDRPFASVPYALSAVTAQSAVIADGSISKSMLGSDVIADLNATIGINRLSAEVTAKLDQNGSGASGIVAGSLISVPYGQSAPTGYSLYQQGTPKELVWEEKAPVSVARWSSDGVEILNEKIYFVGGKGGNDDSVQNIAERFNPVTNTWENMSPMTTAREGESCAVLGGKIFAIGGMGLTSVEIYNSSTNTWSSGASLPGVTERASAIAVNGLIYLVGGRDGSGQTINKVHCLDPMANQWSQKTNMPTARNGHQLVWFGNRIWALGGQDGINPLNTVESYDPNTDTWQTEESLTVERHWAVAWLANDAIYVGGGKSSLSDLNSIESYDPLTELWSQAGIFPENKYVAGAVVLNEKAYVVAGITSTSSTYIFSNKVYAADLNASVAGVYNLYRKDGNASAGTPLVQAEVADGSVTTAKLDSTIHKYLKPEITAHPQTQNVYAHSSAAFSVTAEGKFLTYQWKKDGSNLTGETNSTLTITDANATQHDGNYSVLVSNDFGSVETGVAELAIEDFSLFSYSGLMLWLDASGLMTAESLWIDKSGNGNHATKYNNPTVVTNAQNGLSLMRYETDGGDASATDYHEWQDINDIRTVFCVIKRDADATGNWSQAIADDNNHHFFAGSPGNILDSHHAHANVLTGLTRLNGLSITGTSVAFPTSLSVLIHRTTGNVEASRIGKDRHYTGNYSFDGDYGELLIFNTALSDDYISEIEGYLAHKWGLTANLPSNHPYKNNAP